MKLLRGKLGESFFHITSPQHLRLHKLTRREPPLRHARLGRRLPQALQVVGAWVHGHHRPPPFHQHRQRVGPEPAPHVQEPLALLPRVRLGPGLPAEGLDAKIEPGAVLRGLRAWGVNVCGYLQWIG